MRVDMAGTMMPVIPRTETSAALAADDKTAESRRSEADETLRREMQARDRQVRAHERAHQMVGGRYANPPRLEYERGPDGVMYAVAGEVSIDATPVVDDPEATIDKMMIVHAAALAPADPSAQDRQIAAMALRERFIAEMQLVQKSEADPSGEAGVDYLV